MDLPNQPPPPLLQQKQNSVQDSKKTLATFQFISKIVHWVMMIYIFCVIYRKLHVNGVDYGIYLQPIANIPFWPILFIALTVQYIIENLKDNTAITPKGIEKDFINVTANMMNENPARIGMKYLWNSIKTTFKYMFLSILLIFPVMILLSVIQMIVAGSGSGTFSASY